MLPAAEICESARLARDPRFDGRFIVAVVTTGIYCRPICPARSPARENVRYFGNAAAAQDAGYRPCLRCRPERATALPEWTLGSDTVIRGLRLINAGYLSDHTVAELAAELGISSRHLGRLFAEELGTTPKSIVRAQRLHLAKRLLDETPLKISDVALAAGYGSVRRFNDEISRLFGRSPRQLRNASRKSPRTAGSSHANGRRASTSHGEESQQETLTLQLPVRQPYDQDWVFSFLKLRAMPALEQVNGLTWLRRLGPAEDSWLKVSWKQGGLEVEVPQSAALDVSQLLSRVRTLFDLDADSSVIDAALGQDDYLADRIRRRGGVRVPGAWDGFELGVRAILGQQVSVARATGLGTMLMQQYGEDGLFPTAEILADHNVSKIGMPRSRGAAIQKLAEAVLRGDLCLDPGADLEVMRRNLVAIPGIGPWTADYIAMRAGRDPDAFPEQDWVVLKRLGTTAAGARRQAEPWRPWRAYALMYLWSHSEHSERRQTGSTDEEKEHV